MLRCSDKKNELTYLLHLSSFPRVHFNITNMRLQILTVAPYCILGTREAKTTHNGGAYRMRKLVRRSTIRNYFVFCCRCCIPPYIRLVIYHVRWKYLKSDNHFITRLGWQGWQLSFIPARSFCEKWVVATTQTRVGKAHLGDGRLSIIPQMEDLRYTSSPSPVRDR